MEGKTFVNFTSPDGVMLKTAGTYCESDVCVIPKLQSKVATDKTLVTADDGYVGLSSVDVAPVHEAGKKSEYDEIMDSVQSNGNRDSYPYTFWSYWNLKGIPLKYAVKISRSYGATQTFAYNWTAENMGVDIIVTNGVEMSSTFEGCTNLHTLKLFVSEDVMYRATFLLCTKLVNLTIEGTIGQNGFDVSWSPLSKASLISVINALSSTTTGLTVTVRASAVKKAFETSEGANDGMSSEEWLQLVSTKPNWTINAIDS